MARLRRIFWIIKYRFDLGQVFLSVLNLSLLIMSNTERLGLWLGIPRLRNLLLLLVPIGLVGVYLAGAFLDTIMKHQANQERIATNRSPLWQESWDRGIRIERMLEELLKKEKS